jgi:TubC N-terminal docking domain
MSALALDLLREVSEAGCTVRLEGDMLRLSAPEPLPDDMLARLRQHKAKIVTLLAAAEPVNDHVPAPVVDDQVDQDLPAEVADGVRAILAAEGAQGVPPHRWPQIQRDTWRLVQRRWLHTALDLGWSTADLFGCDQQAPWYRLDRSGLVLLLGGHQIVELSSAMATLRTRTGSVLRFRRRPPAEPPVALLWDVMTPRVHGTRQPPAQATGPPIRAPTAHPSEGADGGDVLGRTPPPS